MCFFFLGLCNFIDVELFIFKVDGEEIDDDLLIMDEISLIFFMEEL